jgi:hypothetical protein
LDFPPLCNLSQYGGVAVSTREQKMAPSRDPLLTGPLPVNDSVTRLPPHLRDSDGLAGLEDPRLLRALGWWRSLVGQDGTLPDCCRIEAATIEDLLPYAMRWDAILLRDGGLRYRCRFAGRLLVQVLGRDTTGMWLEEMYGHEAGAMQSELDAVVHEARPMHSLHRMNWALKEHFRYRRLMLPFTHHAYFQPGDDPQRVALLFNVVSFLPE